MKRKALVTGGTRGIGRAIADKLRFQGIDVWVTGTRGQSNTEGRYFCVNFDEPNSLDSFLAALRNESFDILVNNAGVNRIFPFLDFPPVEFERIQRVNLLAPFQICQAVLPEMVNNQWGRIANIASIFSLVSKEMRSAYSASKFALDGMTKSLSIEMASKGILVNCVSPGFIDTELTQTVLGKEGIERLVKQVPAGRLGKPEEVASIVAFLVSEENTFITGQNIVVDGGFSIA